MCVTTERWENGRTKSLPVFVSSVLQMVEVDRLPSKVY